jgi:hypothetical protein
VGWQGCGLAWRRLDGHDHGERAGRRSQNKTCHDSAWVARGFYGCVEPFGRLAHWLRRHIVLYLSARPPARSCAAICILTISAPSAVAACSAHPQSVAMPCCPFLGPCICCVRRPLQAHPQWPIAIYRRARHTKAQAAGPGHVGAASTLIVPTACVHIGTWSVDQVQPGRVVPTVCQQWTWHVMLPTCTTTVAVSDSTHTKWCSEIASKKCLSTSREALERRRFLAVVIGPALHHCCWFCSV